jgi:hypothetical protein
LRIGKLAFDSGKHILCEKPLCMNVKETLELVEYGRKKKLFLMEVSHEIYIMLVSTSTSTWLIFWHNAGNIT